MVSISSTVHLCNTLFESILKPVYEHYKYKMTQMNKERKGKTKYTKKIKTHVASGWCVYSTFAYGDVLGPKKMYCGEDCVGKFAEHIENEVK